MRVRVRQERKAFGLWWGGLGEYLTIFVASLAAGTVVELDSAGSRATIDAYDPVSKTYTLQSGGKPIGGSYSHPMYTRAWKVVAAA